MLTLKHDMWQWSRSALHVCGIVENNNLGPVSTSGKISSHFSHADVLYTAVMLLLHVLEGQTNYAAWT